MTQVRDEESGPMRTRVKTGAHGGSLAAILDAAKFLFLEAGYTGVNLEQVAQLAGVSRQTVYNQFGSKEAVFRAVVERHWDTIKSEVAAFFAEPIAFDADPGDVLRRFAGAILRFASETDQVAVTRLVVAEARRLPWIAEEFYRLGKEPLLKAFASGLARMTERGLLRCADPQLAAHQFMGLVQEFIVWPQVMAIGPAAVQMPGSEVVIEEAVLMFLGRYGRVLPSGNGRDASARRRKRGKEQGS
jgi:TetR/AcrR family transcriptional regulator of autoinduction and epiphytic fitness